MGELFASFSDIMFSLVIGYMGAIEFLYVMRHLYHWSFNHDANRNGEDDDNLVNIQQNLRRQLNEAANQENITGYNVMRDGISYKDGFRLDPYGHEGAQEQEKFEKKIAQEKSERYKQLEEEYAEQKKLKEQIEDDLRKAEEAYLQKMGYLISETKMDVHQTDIKKEQEALQIMMNTARDRENKEENQNEISMEFKKEPRFQRGEIELSKLPVNSDQMIQIPEDLKIKHGIGSEVRYVDSMEIPTQSGSDQVLQCTIEKSKELLDMGRNSPEMIEQIVHNDILDTESIESAPYVLLSIKPNLNDIDESKENIYAIENIDNEGNNDREGLILADQNSKNNVSEHNIVNIPQEQFVKETDIQNEIIEEIITQKDIDFSLKESPTLSSQNEETYTSNNKNMLMDSSLEASSTILVQNEKISSSDNPSFKQSPLLCEESDNTLSVESEVTNSGNDVSLRTDFKHTQSELMPKDVEQVILEDDDNVTPQLYTEDYLRSLDGIKNKKRERSLHRRAFKKQRSSGSSNSSMESRTSRDEELEVFTSLEEEEMKRIGENFQPIIYTAEPPIKSKGHQSHKSRKKNEVSSVQEESNSAEKTYVKTDENVPFEMSAFDNSISSKRDPEKESNYRETKEDSKDELNTSGALATSTKPKLIFSGEYTKAMDKDWHSGHFCCWQCDDSLTGQRYVIRDDHPYCIKCYENVFANTCEECNKIIGIDSKDLSYKDKHWHEACFLCCKCHLSLVDKQFGAKADRIYCGNCYDAQFASRCDGCGEVFRAGTKKMEYKTRQWHENCFCCCVCQTAIGTKSFIPREQEIYCTGCYEEKFATRCIKCNKVITSGGVTYKNEPWHRECFTCTNCKTALAGQRFTSRDEKPYCAECFGELFAKRCTSCVKPITGIGGTRFISFEDRHWHHDCFVCANCKTSLVGRGFITDGPDIICPECAKQKLM